MIPRRIGSGYTFGQFEADARISLLEGIFFPLKLFVHHGVEDEELVLKSVRALIEGGVAV